MTPLQITPDIGQSPWADLRLREGDAGLLVRIGLLRHGTVDGTASVALLVELPDGRRVVAQTTWALLRTAYIALAASPVAAEEVTGP